MADRTGQQLGHYRLVSLLGRGGFAEVYLGEHLRLKTQAAIKVLYTALDEEDIEGFLREAQTVARLKHPHIVRVFDFDVQDHTPYLVMDYLPNGNVRRAYPKGTALPLATIVSYVKQVASALQYAHDQKLIHRDVKPENMLLDQDNSIVLSDFGIALMAQSSRYQSTQEVAGTAAYMAPEQFQGHPHRASDQYALGIVVYEWLSGDRPFHGTFSEIASQHMFVPPPSLSEKSLAISADIELIVMRSLAKDPQQRFESAMAFVAALEEASNPTQRSANTPILPAGVSVDPQSAGMPYPPTLEARAQQYWPATAQQASEPLPPLPEAAIAPLSSSNPPLGVASRGISSSQRPSSPGQAEFQRTSNGPVQPVSTLGVFSSDYRGEAPEKRGISRRLVIAGLSGAVALIGLGGTGLAWFTLTQGTRTGQDQHGSPIASNSPVSSPANQPTQPPTPTQPPVPAQGTTIYTFTGHSRGIRVLQWSPNSNRIATGSDDYTAKVWGATDGSNVVTYTGHSSFVEGVAWSPDGSRIASGSADKTVQIWNPNTGTWYYTYTGHSLWVNRICWSPDGQYIVSGEQASKVGYVVQARVWQVATGNTLVVYKGHTNGIFSVAWSPDGKRVASCGYDGTLQIWEGLTGNLISTFNAGVFLWGLSWSPDSSHVVVGG